MTPDDLGLTHIALSVSDIEASVDFYRIYGGLQVAHRREDTADGVKVAWLADGRRAVALVLIEEPRRTDTALGPFGHIGIACASRDEVDRLASHAAGEGRLLRPPQDSGAPIGYWCFLSDPDGNTLELSFGQRIEHTVADQITTGVTAQPMARGTFPARA